VVHALLVVQVVQPAAPTPHKPSRALCVSCCLRAHIEAPCARRPSHGAPIPADFWARERGRVSVEGRRRLRAPHHLEPAEPLELRASDVHLCSAAGSARGGSEQTTLGRWGRMPVGPQVSFIILRQWLRFPYVSIHFIVGSDHDQRGGACRAHLLVDDLVLDDQRRADYQGERPVGQAAARDGPTMLPCSEPRMK
jgi:hypothetical protein